MKIENNKAVFSQEEGTIVKVNECWGCVNKERITIGDTLFHTYQPYFFKATDANNSMWDDCSKVLAANLKLEGVPLLVKKSFKSTLKELILKECTDDYVEKFEFYEETVIKAHNAHAETHPFTEEDVRRALLEMAKICRESRGLLIGAYVNEIIPNSDEIIQKLHQPQIPERLELELEVIPNSSWGVALDEPEILGYQLKSEKGIIYY